ncbi:MAG: DUF4124 domain-containing protein, partial [Massilia sp.]
MQLKKIHKAILVASLLAASTAFAGSDIYKCVDQDGRTTLTDEPCESGSKTVVLAAGAESPAVMAAGAESPAMLAPTPARAAVASMARFGARVAPP